MQGFKVETHIYYIIGKLEEKNDEKLNKIDLVKLMSGEKTFRTPYRNSTRSICIQILVLNKLYTSCNCTFFMDMFFKF